MSFTINSGIRIFDVLAVLLENPYSKKEFVKMLSKRGVFIDEGTVPKYIRTLRAAGYEIECRKLPFKVCKTPFRFDFSEEEIKGFNIAMSVLKELLTGEYAKKAEFLEYKISNIIKPFFVYKRKKALKIDYAINDVVSSNICYLSKFDDLKSIRLKVAYKRKICIIRPKELRYRKNGFFLFVYNETAGKNETLKLEYIRSPKLIGNVPSLASEFLEETTFKITGRLKKNYVLKIGERAHYFDNEILVTNALEDKEELFNRLIKYGKYCEVLYPESDREKFIEKLKNLIKYYQSI